MTYSISLSLPTYVGILLVSILGIFISIILFIVIFDANFEELFADMYSEIDSLIKENLGKSVERYLVQLKKELKSKSPKEDNDPEEEGDDQN